MGDNGLLIGIVSGIVASICFSLFLLLVRPRIKVSSEICKDPNEENLYRIKVVNRSRFILNNLQYSLHYCIVTGDGIKQVQELKPRKSPLSYVHGYKKTGSTDYAVRLSFFIDQSIYPFDNAVLEFGIMANHSLSNTMCCKKVTYTSASIQEGFFETGESMTIIRSQSRCRSESTAVPYGT